MKIERICFYVEDAKQWRDWFIEVMGFTAIATSRNFSTYTEVIGSGAIVFSFSSPLSEASPVAVYLQKHPPGVVDIEFVVPNLEAILTRIQDYGGAILTPVQIRGDRHYCQIQSPAGIAHTLWKTTDKKSLPRDSHLFHEIDHIVLNVEAGQLKPTVDWYRSIFGFECQQTFNIQTMRSGLHSQVMVHPKSGIKIPVNEPTSPNSQIQEFVNQNCGSGVQHIALQTKQIVATTAKLREAGVHFLDVPATYYRQLRSQLHNLFSSEREWVLIEREKILVDCQFPLENDPPILLQIFTKPIFSTPTFFFEIIERRQQAEGFGEGNFRALFEAIEREQMKQE
ncbi:MAG: 4-hydroxyphenylpyruvate dioxygenase [Cyanobacteria bacterium SBLK]|nr:4-hydroxyphenylpyruvate dioxygenase [Cyanobacteria bacterium SBLK]